MTFPQRLQVFPMLFHRLSAQSVFAALLLSVPPFLLQQDTVRLWAEVLVFLLLALIQRKKLRLLPSVLLTLCLVFFELLNPRGRILYMLRLPFADCVVSADALRAGLRKSGVLVGMLFLSQAAISPELRVPGRAGCFFSYIMRINNELVQGRPPLLHGFSIAALDAHLCRIWQSVDAAEEAPSALSTQHTLLQKVLPFILPVLLVLLHSF